MSNKNIINYQKKRKEVLEKIFAGEFRSPELIEKIIKDKIREIFKQEKGKYFDLKKFTEIAELKGRLFTFIFLGQRNIGKSYNCKTFVSERWALSPHDNRSKFIWMRIQENEIVKVMNNENEWLENNCWVYVKSKNIIESDIDGETVGHAVSLGSMAGIRSSEYANVKTVIFDEFSTTASQSVLGNVDKFIHFTSTAQRNRKDFYVIMTANYIDPSDPFLTAWGMEYKENELINIDWVSGIITIFIPENTYHSFSDLDNIGGRLSLTSLKSFVEQQGEGYFYPGEDLLYNMRTAEIEKEYFNIYLDEKNYLTMSKIKNRDIFYIYESINFELTLWTFDKETNMRNSKSFLANKKFTFYKWRDLHKRNKIRYQNKDVKLNFLSLINSI